MVRILTIALAFISFALISKAQPVITSSNYPLANDTYQGIVDLNYGWQPGSAGANVTWDFSGLATTSPGPFSYIAPSSTPYGTSFPNSNVAISQLLAYLYYNVSTSEIDIAGSTYTNITPPNTTFIRTFTDPQKLVTFPFTYLDNLKDTAKTGSYPGGTGETKRLTCYSESKADGYGTLILPGSRSYTDVLRIKITSQTIDSSFNTSDGSYKGSRDVTFDTSYYWISESHKPHLLLLEKNNSLTSVIAQYFTDPATPTGIVTSVSKYIKVYPNPAQSEIMVEIENSQFNNASSFTLSISDIKGNEEIITKTISSPAQRISLHGLKPGNYFYYLKNGIQVLEAGKLSIQ